MAAGRRREVVETPVIGRSDSPRGWFVPLCVSDLPRGSFVPLDVPDLPWG